MWWVNEVQLSGLRCYDCSDPNRTEPRLQMSWKLWTEVLRVLTNLWPGDQPLTTDSTSNCLHRATANLNSADLWYCMTKPWRWTVSWTERTATTNNTFLVLNGQRLRDLYAYSTQCETHPSFNNVFFKNWIDTEKSWYSTKLFWVIHPSDQPGIVIKIPVLAPGLRV